MITTFPSTALHTVLKNSKRKEVKSAYEPRLELFPVSVAGSDLEYFYSPLVERASTIKEQYVRNIVGGAMVTS